MSLYDSDFLAWTRQQADLLRSMPGTHSLDIEHLIDEIKGLGRSAVAGLPNALIQVLSGLVRRSLDSSLVNIDDILSAQAETIIRAEAGVWRHFDLAKIWRLAKRSVDAELPDRCPIFIEPLIADDFDVEKAIAAFRL